MRNSGSGGRDLLVLRVIGAGLLVATAAIHLDLYLTGYRTIPTIGWLFLLQLIVAFVLAAAVLATSNWLPAAVGAVFALSVLGGYLLTVWIGLFGFKEVSTTAGIAAGIVEVAAFAALASAAILSARRQGLLTGLPASLQSARIYAGAVGAACAVAIVLLAVDLAERILGGFGDRDYVQRAASRALEDLRADEDGTIYAAPGQMRALATHIASITGGRQIAVEADPNAGPRDCTLMTTRGVMKLDAESQLDALRSGIRSWYSNRGGP